MKIPWSGRAHNYNKKDIKYLTNIIKYADPLTQGSYLKRFEKNFGSYIKKKNVFAVSSAAASLELIALLLDIKKNDEIILPAHTYCATAIPFARNGAKLVWADIDFQTRVVDFEDIKRKVNSRTKAIIIVHLYGFGADVRKIISFCKSKKIKIIEDCAQAIGAEIAGKKVGTFGDFSCFSFHAQKNITTLGEGGIIYVKDNLLAKKVPGLRHNGHCDFNFYRKKYWSPAMGNLDLDLKNKWPYKFTLSEIQCGAGIIMLQKLDKLNRARIKRAKSFIDSLKKFPEISFVKSDKKFGHVYHLLSAYYHPSKKVNKNHLIEKLYEKYNIKCIVQYYPLYKYDLFKKMGFGGKKLSNTEKFFNNMISFPFHVWMSNREFKYLLNSVKKSLIELRKIREI